jgi:hypothetical protein
MAISGEYVMLLLSAIWQDALGINLYFYLFSKPSALGFW